MKHILYTLLLLLSLSFWACGEDENGDEPASNHQNTEQTDEANTTKEDSATTATTEPNVSKLPPTFDADTAYKFIEKQLSFGPRVPNTSAHLNCADWLVKTFERFGAKVTVQGATVEAPAFNNKQLSIQNIIASYRPEANTRIMLSAHWDSRPIAEEDPSRQDEPIPAANDGASGVAVLLEIARVLQEHSPQIGVDIMLWDAEDYGKSGYQNSYCLGTQYWALHPHVPNYKAEYCINLDMVGAKSAFFTQEEYSVTYAQYVVKKVWNVAHELGYGAYFPFELDTPIIDDHLYVIRLANIPAIDIIDRTRSTGDFFPQWHTHGDNIDVISTETLKAVGQTVLTVALRERPQ